jgi:hypothetical protein
MPSFPAICVTSELIKGVRRFGGRHNTNFAIYSVTNASGRRSARSGRRPFWGRAGQQLIEDIVGNTRPWRCGISGSFAPITPNLRANFLTSLRAPHKCFCGLWAASRANRGL